MASGMSQLAGTLRILGSEMGSDALIPPVYTHESLEW